MPSKLTYEIIKNNIENIKNYFLESMEYINAHTKLKIRCPNNHIFYMIYNGFQRGQRCPICYQQNKKHTIEFVKKYFKNINFNCLSNKYIDSKTKLKIKCPNNHEFYISFNSFQRLKRCPICYSVKHNIEFIKKYASKFLYICLSTEYKNAHTKLEFQCPKDHKFKMTFANFKNQGQRCPICFKNNNRGKKHASWKLDRTRRIRTKYLCFDHRKKSILKDDPNYNDYLSDKFKYNIDHIFPRIAFVDNDLDNIYGIEIIKKICNLRENLQILLKEENLSKSGKYNQEEFINWFNEKYNELKSNKTNN